jgi:hypothetical protein
MKIYTLWEEGDGGDCPWLVAAVDDETVGECGWPPDYEKKREEKPNGRIRRELLIEFPDSAVTELFKISKVKTTKTEPVKTPLP